jgi:hypothetical protein
MHSIDHIKTKLSSLDSSCQDASNGDKFMPLASIYSSVTPKLFKPLTQTVSRSIDARVMRPPPFDSSQWDESNEL